ncbi:hypothetical protein SCHPADRAFT_506728 [Schizopora paradoxa]|uniref:Uncharacterized protein n=1 Tax=Schizopora paradoxa TaxID=27342 RepID=A0A0H2RGE7_9AGAM|nr:hypothetical protein SCHPADRAFT_506728 [Schizopora paradoxa]
MPPSSRDPEPPNEMYAPHELPRYAGQERERTANPYAPNNARGGPTEPRYENIPPSNPPVRTYTPPANIPPSNASLPEYQSDTYLPSAGRSDSFSQKYDDVEQTPAINYTSYSMTFLQEPAPPPRPKTPPQVFVMYNNPRRPTPPPPEQPVYYNPPPRTSYWTVRRTLSSLISLGISIGLIIYFLIHYKVI